MAPLDGGEELLDRFHDHRSAPDYGGIAFEQETHAHEFDSIIGRWNHFLVLAESGALVDAHHKGNAWAVNITIQQPHARPQILKGASEIN